MKTALSDSRKIELVGIDGTNPLGFLAALGTLYLLSAKPAAASLVGPARMSWSDSSFAPVLHFDRMVDPSSLTNCLCEVVQGDFVNGQRPAFLYNDIIAVGPKTFRAVLTTAVTESRLASLDLLSGFGSDAHIQAQGKKAGCIEPSQISFSNGQSMRYLLDAYAHLVVGVTTKSSTYPAISAAKIAEALFDRWTYTDDHKELRWDPSELRLGAIPSQARGTVHGANVLAFWALAVLRSVPTFDGVQTAGVHLVHSAKRRRKLFLMPQWRHPISLEVARSLMESDLIRQRISAPVDLSPVGISSLFACEIITEMKANYFAPSSEL